MTRLPRRRRTYAKVVLTPVQLRLLVTRLPEPCSLVFLLMLTGLRIGELLALRWRGVDLLVGLVRIEETVYEGHFDEPKSGHSIRLIPLGPLAVAILSERRKEGFVEPSTLVFSSRTGSTFDRRTLLSRQLPQRRQRDWAT